MSISHLALPIQYPLPYAGLRMILPVDDMKGQIRPIRQSLVKPQLLSSRIVNYCWSILIRSWSLEGAAELQGVKKHILIADHKQNHAISSKGISRFAGILLRSSGFLHHMTILPDELDSARMVVWDREGSYCYLSRSPCRVWWLNKSI